MNTILWLGNLLALIFLFLKMLVKCLLVSLKQPEMTLVLIVALCKKNKIETSK